MIVTQIYTGCLAQAAYYIESNGVAAVIDPLRDTTAYLDRAAGSGARIQYIFETHFHADFVSGHLDLAKATGATIVYGPTAQPGFDALVAKDFQQFRIGAVTLEVLHTPGHTMESCCYLLKDEAGIPVYLFSGDTLFIGDVGRPDLAQSATGLTREALAGLLYDSIQRKILPLPDEIIVYPGHGAGSACGKHLGKERYDTLGHQKATNYALRPGLTREAFIRETCNGLPKPPGYFPFNALMNKQGYAGLDTVRQSGLRPLDVPAFETTARNAHALILDTRGPEVFASGFIPGAINIGIDGNFAPWVGLLIRDIRQPLLLVADEGREDEVVTRLARVGYEHCLGYLQGGMGAWTTAGKAIDTVTSRSAEAVADLMEEDPDVRFLDVRQQQEFDEDHVSGATHFPLEAIHERQALPDEFHTWHVYCAGGYRSMIFCSIMKARGCHNLVNIAGGFAAIEANGRIFTTHPAPQMFIR